MPLDPGGEIEQVPRDNEERFKEDRLRWRLVRARPDSAYAMLQNVNHPENYMQVLVGEAALLMSHLTLSPQDLLLPWQGLVSYALQLFHLSFG